MTTTETIKTAIYNLCLSANTTLGKTAYEKILSAFERTTNDKQKEIIRNILLNAKIANETKRPLCQDTGQVLVFAEIGQNAKIEGSDFKTAINEGVEKCYRENFFRKSVVKNALSERINTNTNTPAIIYTDIVSGDKIKLSVLIKGAGSENKSSVIMGLPTYSKEELKEKIVEAILSSDINACPPMFVGIGIGQTLEGSALLSKKALLTNDNKNKEFEDEILNELNEKAPSDYRGIYTLDVKIISEPTHIASMPIGITLNCHSMREAQCTIEENQIIYNENTPNFSDLKQSKENRKEVFTDKIDELRSLKKGEDICLTGEIFVARDEAHKRIVELIKKSKPLPFEIKDKIIFYAGPCPAKEGEIIGPIGPTTAGRMDKFAVKLYDLGLAGTIGKGSRGKEVTESIRRNKGVYFTVQGGIASLLKTCIKKSEIIAFSELGAEAIYKLYVEKLPVSVSISQNH